MEETCVSSVSSLAVYTVNRAVLLACTSNRPTPQKAKAKSTPIEEMAACSVVAVKHLLAYIV